MLLRTLEAPEARMEAVPTTPPGGVYKFKAPANQLLCTSSQEKEYMHPRLTLARNAQHRRACEGLYTEELIDCDANFDGSTVR